jgi:hypothetical protein
MNMSTASSRAQNEAAPPKAARPEEGRRNAPENQEKAKDFSARLEKLAQSNANAKATPESNNLDQKDLINEGPVKGWQEQDDGQSQGQDQSGSDGTGAGGGGLAPVAIEFARTVALAQATPVDTVPPEHLARIIAALEELVENGTTAEYQVSLPAGPTTIEGAVLGRDPTGKLNIQLIANAVIPAAALQQLQTALRQRMANHKGQLGKLDVSYGRKTE